jgi:hypothetical protein
MTSIAAFLTSHRGIPECYIGLEGIKDIECDALRQCVPVENAAQSKDDAGRHDEIVNEKYPKSQDRYVLVNK